MCELIQIMGYKETLTTWTETFFSVGKNAHGWLEIRCISEEMHQPLSQVKAVMQFLICKMMKMWTIILLLTHCHVFSPYYCKQNFAPMKLEKHINWEITPQKHIHVKSRSRILVIVQIVLILLSLDWVTMFRGIWHR